MDIKFQVGEKIKYLRKQKGISRETLALMSEISPSFLGHIERGLKSPTVTTLEKISKALNVPIYEFFIFSKINHIDEATILIERISYTLRDSSPEDILHIANIIDEILKIKSE